MHWRKARRIKANAITKYILDYLKLDYSAYFDTGHFRIDLNQRTPLQYFSTTGAYGFYTKDEEGNIGFPTEHLRASTPKRFYEQVLMQYLEDIPPWTEMRELLKSRPR